MVSSSSEAHIMANTLNILAYNSTGLASDICDFICDIIESNDPCILLLQEAWLINSKLNTLNNIHKNYLANMQCMTMNY